MILDRLENAPRYFGLHGAFPKAFEFLSERDLSAIRIGRTEIDGDRVYAIVSDVPGRSRHKGQLETHARYIDVQYVVSGVDEMGWKPASECRQPAVPYDPEKDVVFYTDEPDAWISVRPGSFVVFFPEDAHLPLVSDGEIRKVVVKVAVT